jgi:diadenosine tetraphosphatase ApaH/serine/threonine PP2A family protein phosphatase
MSDIDEYIETLKEGGILEETELKQLCDKVKEIMMDENNIVQVRSPCNIVGDIHGQFHDLLEIFRIGGEPPDANYIFLGDYVDRGYNSIEVMELLLWLKVKFPQRIVLLRGNHETRQVSSVYGFYDEVVRKYGNANAWKLITEIFDCMSIAAIINNEVFWAHGGLSPDAELVDEIELIDRFQEIPSTGPHCDLMWSDPTDDNDWWGVSPRGAGYLFGKDITTKFWYVNRIGFVCRAHQLCMDGYQYWHENRLLTVWSAPNYTYRWGNKAIILNFDEKLNKTINIFDAWVDNKNAVPTETLIPYFL